MLHLLLSQAYILEMFKILGITSEIIKSIHDSVLSRALRQVCGATACQPENRIAGVVGVLD